MIQFLLACSKLGATRCSTYAVVVAAEVDGVNTIEASELLNIPVRHAKAALRRAVDEGLLTKTNWLRNGHAVYRVTGLGGSVVKRLKKAYLDK